MANFNFLDSARVTAQEIYEDTRTYLSRVYKKSNSFFTSASPYAQILEVMSYIGELLMFYIEDATVEQNIYTAQQPESIYGSPLSHCPLPISIVQSLSPSQIF